MKVVYGQLLALFSCSVWFELGYLYLQDMRHLQIPPNEAIIQTLEEALSRVPQVGFVHKA